MGNGGTSANAQPLFWVDCDNNNIDKISGLPAVANGIPQTSRFVLDPTDRNRYCLRKNTGSNNFLYVQFTSFPSGNPFALTENQPTAGTTIFDTYHGGGNRLEFMVYVNTDTANRVWIMTGDLFGGFWQTQGGVDLGLFGQNLMIYARNNSATNITKTLIAHRDIVNRWVTVQYDV